jgi:Ni/Co efflux regulator RcnB
MLKRIIASTFMSGMMLVSASHVAWADGRHHGGDDRRSEHHDNGRDRGHDRHDNNRHDNDRRDGGRHDRGRDRDDYSRQHGYDRDYYGYYGSGCNGYRDGYYYDSNGRPYSRDGRPSYRRNGDCDNYYNNNGTYYGSPSCDRYDYQTGYCG